MHNLGVFLELLTRKAEVAIHELMQGRQIMSEVEIMGNNLNHYSEDNDTDEVLREMVAAILQQVTQCTDLINAQWHRCATNESWLEALYHTIADTEIFELFGKICSCLENSPNPMITSFVYHEPYVNTSLDELFARICALDNPDVLQTSSRIIEDPNLALDIKIQMLTNVLNPVETAPVSSSWLVANPSSAHLIPNDRQVPPPLPPKPPELGGPRLS